MNKEFNSDEERYRTIRKLCKMDMEHRRSMQKLHDAVDSVVSLGGGDADFIYELFSVDGISELILDLFLNGYEVNREYYDEIWDAYVWDEDGIEDDILIDSFISVMEQHRMELDIETLNKGKKGEA